MKAYILSLAGVILISAVISVIAPAGKMGGFVKGMTRLFIFVVLISPFVRFVKSPETFLTGAEIETDDGYLRTYSSMLSRSDEETITSWLEETYGVTAETKVSRSFDDFSYEKITVRVVDFGINEVETHIDILSAIGEKLHGRYGCEVEVS